MQNTDTAYRSGYNCSPPRRKQPPKKRSGAGFIVFILSCAILAILSTTVFFNIKNVVISGSSIYSSDEIISASGIKGGDNLVKLSIDRCSNQILNELIYIENAEISRKFPSTVEISVTASEPAANFICDDGIYLISKDGKTLDYITEQKADLLNFTGTDPAEGTAVGQHFASQDDTKTTIIYKLMELFLDADNEKITSIDVTDNANITFLYDNRITVELGNINDIDYKYSFSMEILSEKINDSTEGVLTILSESNQASFMDKSILENNDLVYSANMEQRSQEETAVTDEDGNVITDDGSDDDSDNSSADPIME